MMGKKHDELIYSLTNEKIIELVAKEMYGEKSDWCNPLIDKICKEGFDNLSYGELKKFLDWIEYDDYFNKLNLIKMREKLINESIEISNTSLINSIIMDKKEVEIPIIKGEGQYRRTMGFIDMVCKLKPKSTRFFSCYQVNELKNIVIEVKKLTDFNDTGNIIRQLNEYREYFKWYQGQNIDSFFVYCDMEIPPISEKLLKEQGYKVIYDKFQMPIPIKVKDGKVVDYI